MFTHLPMGCLQHPDMEVGLLIGQNATALLPTSGAGWNAVDNLRVGRTVLGEFGYVIEGSHPSLRVPGSSKVSTNAVRLSHSRILVKDSPSLANLSNMKGNNLQTYLQSLPDHNLPEMKQTSEDISGNLLAVINMSIVNMVYKIP